MNYRLLTCFFVVMLHASSSLAALSQGECLPKEMVYTPSATTFTLQFPTEAKGVVVRLYREGEGGKPLRQVAMKRNAEQRWTATVRGDWKGCFYTFELVGKGLGESPGIDARAVGVNGQRGAIIDWKTTQPEGWERDTLTRSLRDKPLVIYELHHRDFSIDPQGGFRHPGKFLALTEPRALDHLRQLGVTAVHLLPSFDFASVDEAQLWRPQYNWGYDPLNYNVPEGSYSTNPYEPATRIREFKQMVMALHKAGIRVILDVVYNHTFDLVHSNFQRLYPQQFYRFTSDGHPSNGSGCGNETASERAFMRTFMRQSVRYWVEEFHVDGFRFDLMGVHDLETMRLIRQDLHQIDPRLVVYGEGWSAGACALPEELLATKAHVGKIEGVAAFSDELRDGLRGPFSDDHKGGFLAGVLGNEESIKFGLVGGVAHPQVDMNKVNYSKTPWASSPQQLISYVSCHDDLCLTDRLRASIPGLSEEELIRLDLLAQTAVFTSQGTPFMMAGEEFLRSKKGVHNSFNAPDSINMMVWENKEKYSQVFQYYRGLVALRRLGFFGSLTAQQVRERVRFADAPSGVIAYQIAQPSEHGNDYLVVVLNARKEDFMLRVQPMNYLVVARNGHFDTWLLNGGEEIPLVRSDQFRVAPQSALILLCRGFYNADEVHRPSSLTPFSPSE